MTPLATPRVDRRRPSEQADSVRLDPEAALASVEQLRQLRGALVEGLPGASSENVLLICITAYLRTLRQAERRHARFPLSSGTAIDGVHAGDVQAALAVIQHWGGLVLEGPRGEETVARALGAAYAAREQRLANGRPHHRRRDPVVAAMAAEVAVRVAVHQARTVVSGAAR